MQLTYCIHEVEELRKREPRQPLAGNCTQKLREMLSHLDFVSLVLRSPRFCKNHGKRSFALGGESLFLVALDLCSLLLSAPVASRGSDSARRSRAFPVFEEKRKGGSCACSEKSQKEGRQIQQRTRESGNAVEGRRSRQGRSQLRMQFAQTFRVLLGNPFSVTHAAPKRKTQ
ncbi:hypothetical protein TGCAST_387830 [Toxoplasma gondii CAST]|uniref:Uncharacterized protein n=1 Tax=Toxoplasma gondii CAST TaxID=943122 RepID=A0A3R7YTM6_TOXGO|nr:hypothetical protein TGCAST_387830 [Toxoplasma gondii CAST]